MKRLFTAISRIILYAFPFIFLQSCGIKDQAEQLKALENCTFSISSADSIYLADTDVSRLVRSGGLNLAATPRLMMAFMQQKVPLKARINVQIQNPGDADAGINEFEYKLLVKDTELTSGYYNKHISVAKEGGTVLVPFWINTDVYPLLSKPENQKAISDFFSANAEKTTVVTFKIKPSFMAGNEKISYPGFISISKEISNKDIVAILRNN